MGLVLTHFWFKMYQVILMYKKYTYKIIYLWLTDIDNGLGTYIIEAMC